MNLLDLPNEIILYILDKMNVVDTLFRQSGLNRRLDQILFSSIHVRELDFTIKSWDQSISPIDDLVINQVCEKILPRINDKIIKLTLEPYAIGRILNSTTYSKVSSLSLLNFRNKILLEHLTENDILIQLLRQQITHLRVNGTEETNYNYGELKIFELILSLSKHLVELTFHQSFKINNECLFMNHLSSTIPLCSTLTKLDIQVNTIGDCFSLLGDHFPSLSHYSVYIPRISSTSFDINKITNLSQLKYFSLASYVGTDFYDDLIVPFIQKMSYLEELRLVVTVSREDTYQVVDGNNLYTDILIHLPQLKRFRFSIYTFIYTENVSIDKFPLNNDIQQSFNYNRFGEIASYVQHTAEKDKYGCHVYSLPFIFDMFSRLSMSFSGGVFYHVTSLIANDYVPWEESFFKKIAKCFPFIETLMIVNSQPQKNKLELSNEIENAELTTFSRLVELHVDLAHMDYIKQFLFNRCTHLPRLRQLEIKYNKLITLTNNFTNDETRLNCLQVERLMVDECFVRSENFSRFFPLL